MNFLFTSDRLGFRLLTEEDINACQTFWGNDVVMQYTGGSLANELLPQVIDFYQQCQVDTGVSVYAVVELLTNEVIGAAGFNVEDSLEDVELIFHFTQSKWGQGYATETIIALLLFAKNTGSIHKVVASSSIANQAALQVLGKIGFQYRGIKYEEDIDQEEAYFELTF